MIISPTSYQHKHQLSSAIWMEIKMDFITTLGHYLSQNGKDAYYGEPITQLEHALQTAHAALRHKARPELISAALLHDIGHLLHSYDEYCADDDIDSQHQYIGDQYLRRYFKTEVAELVKHHVNAKRYLAGRDANYTNKLSPASIQSLVLQGGPMDSIEMKAFETHPLFSEIILLRHWDDAAKVPEKQTPELAEFYPILRECAL